MTYKTQEDIKKAEMVISPPGETLQETIEAKEISQSELAKRMGRPYKTINEIIKGKAAITSETAVQLERVLGISAEFWMEREKNYWLELEKIQQSQELLELKDWMKNFPLNEMKKLGWINYSQNQNIEKLNAIFNFFAVSSKKAYENYFRNYATGAFRTTNKRNRNPYAVNAWLRKGELQAMEIDAPEFDKNHFYKALTSIQSLMAKHPSAFFEKLQSLCLKAGVKVVYTPALPKTMLHGSTSWKKSNPVIQLSNQYMRNDIFWFTFFHEAGHILLHGKKDVFVEGFNIEYTDEGKRKEEEANELAVKYTFPIKEESRFLKLLESAEDDIQLTFDFAREINTHPALIVGRLAKKGFLHESEGWKHNIYQKIDLSKM